MEDFTLVRVVVHDNTLGTFNVHATTLYHLRHINNPMIPLILPCFIDI